MNDKEKRRRKRLNDKKKASMKKEKKMSNIKELTKWAQNEMESFFKPIESATHIILIGERRMNDLALPMEIEMMSEALLSLPEMAREHLIESHILRPWRCGIMIRYPECFSKEEMEMAHMMLKVYGVPEDPERQIITMED